MRYVLLGILAFVLSAALSLAAVAFVLVRLPADYFSDPRHRHPPRTGHPALHLLARIGKNLLGLTLVILGIALSLPGIPGQGILTILVGLLLMEFPGKYWLERRTLQRPKVLAVVNKLRARFGKPPLEVEPPSPLPKPAE